MLLGKFPHIYYGNWGGGVIYSTYSSIRGLLSLHKSNISPFKKVKVLPVPMVHRAAPISVSVALGHMSVNAVKATVGGWSTGSSTCLTFPLHSLMSSAR